MSNASDPLGTNLAPVIGSRDARGVFDDTARQKSNLLAAAYTLLCLAAFAGSLLLAVAAPWWLALPLVVVNGVTIGILFIIAHDACHGSFFSSGLANQVVGRLCFAPSLTPYAAWQLGHNRLHHGYTSLKSHDYVWRPFSPQEFVQLPAWRRGLERLYRTRLVGPAVYWAIEIWLVHMIFPRRTERPLLSSRLAFELDRLWIVAYVALLTWGLFAWRSWHLPQESPLQAVVMAFVPGVALPFCVWCAIAGLLIYVHHTHPRIEWFADKAQWTFYDGQVRSTTHVLLPGPLNRVFLNIMEHTAHHVDPTVPLYRLPSQQTRLEETFGPDVIVQRLTWPYLRDLMATCHLYDYDNRRWLKFSDAGPR